MARKPKTIAERAKDAGVSTATYNRRLKAATAQEPTRDEKLRQEIRKLKADADKAERYNAMLDGDYYPKSEVDKLLAGVAHVCNALIRAIPAELSPLCAGLSADQIEKRSKDWTIGWAEKLKTAQSEVWTSAQSEVRRDMRGDARKIMESKARKKR